jgi:cell division protein FtsW (lipid II flippase)
MADPDTAPCCRCQEPIPTDVERCPVCAYCPAGRYPLAAHVGAYAFATVVVASLAVLLVAVTGRPRWLPLAAIERVAIVTPYTAGVSAFFAYYLHRKRQATPTDDTIFGRQ